MENLDRAAAEVREAAALLSATADRLQSLKFPGPGGIGESVLVAALPTTSSDPPLLHRVLSTGRPAALADISGERLLIVSHESGPEYFLLTVSAGVATQALWALLATFAQRVLSRRSAIAAPATAAPTLIRREYFSTGAIKSEHEFRFKDDAALVQFLSSSTDTAVQLANQVRYSTTEEPAAGSAQAHGRRVVFDPVSGLAESGRGHLPAAKLLAERSETTTASSSYTSMWPLNRPSPWSSRCARRWV